MFDPRSSMLAATVAALCLGSVAATAQEGELAPLRLAGVMPGGVRTSATDGWGTFDIFLTNHSDTDRLARVLVFYAADPETQFGRDIWVPARSTISSWVLVGPAPPQGPATGREVQTLLYDRTDGEDHLVLPPTEERVRSRMVFYRPREGTTALMLDPSPPEGINFGELPRPEPKGEEALRLARVLRQPLGLSERVQLVPDGLMPPAAVAFDGVDHFILASGRLADDPAGARALRHWLQQGGLVWVMLDMAGPEVAALLLGDALDFRVVDTVSLTEFTVEPAPGGAAGAAPPHPQRHEQPVEFVRVLLPEGERAPHTVNGWPAWFTRRVGRGTVLFTTLGRRAWMRPREPFDPPSPYSNYPDLPVPTAPFADIAAAVAAARPAEPPVDAFREPLTEAIGYTIVPRGTVASVLGGFLLAALAVGVLLRRSRRPELVGGLVPALAVGAAAVLVALGEASRRAVPPSVAVGQLVEGVRGAEEAPVAGLLAMYRPVSGPVEAGGTRGGFFAPELAGLEGRTRRLVRTDMHSWHWEGLDLPAGVRFAPLHGTVATGTPLRAVARFGPDGIEGELNAGPFRGLSDAVLRGPGGRPLAVTLGPEGRFRAGNALPPGQFLAGAVLSDRQQKRQEVYRQLSERASADPLARDEPPALMAWAEPADLGLTLPPGAAQVGEALLVLPLEFERPAPGSAVTVPAPLVRCRRLFTTGSSRPTLASAQPTEMHLRFQIPAAVLPMRVERARLGLKIIAPGRTVAVSGRDGGREVRLAAAQSPLDPIRIDITDPGLLRPDEGGGLHLHVSIGRSGGGDAPGDALGNEEWVIEYLELEVSGVTAGTE